MINQHTEYTHKDNGTDKVVGGRARIHHSQVVNHVLNELKKEFYWC